MISKLTQKQQDLIPVYLKKWLSVGYNTNPINEQKAKDCANFLYSDILGKKLPKYYVFLDSPMQVNLALNLLKMDKNQYSQLRSQLGSQLYSQLDSQLRSQLDSQKMEYFSETRGAWWQTYYYHYDFILNELFKHKVNRPEFVKFNKYINHMKNVHMIYMFNEICFFSNFPKEICVNSIGQLHNEKTAALSYRDGYSLFRLNGISVSEEIVKKDPKNFVKEDITKQNNADTRREIVRKIGNKQLMELLDYKTVDTFEEYKLISFDVGDGRDRPFLYMECPSTKLVHILGVMPGITKVTDALAFLFNQPAWKRPIKEDSINREGDFADFQSGQTIFRHGDVNFKKYSGNINEINNVQTRGVIHKGNNNNHEYANGLFEIQEVEGKRIVVCLDNCIIDHAEHGKQMHPPGTYEVDIAQEYDHWKEEARKVID